MDNINKEPIAILSLTIFSGIYIIDIEHGIDDFIIWRYSDEPKKHRCKAYTSNKGIYFNINGIRYYLDQFMRV